MDFKFDIRILAISVLIHFGAYAMLAIYTQKRELNVDAIEVVIQDDDVRTFLPSKNKKKETQEESKNSKFFSEDQQRVEKETIAQNLGDFRNQKRVVQKKAQAEVQKSEDKTPGPNFMPMQDQSLSQEESQSAISFQAPNVSKGEFTFLNSDFSTYASFYNRITPKILFNWGSNVDDVALFPHMREKLQQKLRWATRVELILNRKGHFKDIIVINSSGSPELDSAVVEALKDAGPYLNPPTGMIEKDGTVHILGEFTVYSRRPRFANP